MNTRKRALVEIAVSQQAKRRIAHREEKRDSSSAAEESGNSDDSASKTDPVSSQRRPVPSSYADTEISETKGKATLKEEVIVKIEPQSNQQAVAAVVMKCEPVPASGRVPGTHQELSVARPEPPPLRRLVLGVSNAQALFKQEAQQVAEEAAEAAYPPPIHTLSKAEALEFGEEWKGNYAGPATEELERRHELWNEARRPHDAACLHCFSPVKDAYEHVSCRSCPRTFHKTCLACFYPDGLRRPYEFDCPLCKKRMWDNLTPPAKQTASHAVFTVDVRAMQLAHLVKEKPGMRKIIMEVEDTGTLQSDVRLLQALVGLFGGDP